MLVMVLQCYKSSSQKSKPLESGHKRHGVWIAIEYSYKLGQKMNLNFCENYIGCRFLQRQSHIIKVITLWHKLIFIVLYSKIAICYCSLISIRKEMLLLCKILAVENGNTS